MSVITTMPRTSGAERTAVRERSPFNVRPVCAAGRESRSAEGPYSTHYTSTANYLYINRLSGSDMFGQVPDGYAGRGDLVTAGRCYPQQKTPPHLREGDALWRAADAAAALEGPRAVSATHIVADLPPEVGPERWTWLIEDYAYRHLTGQGMIVDWAVHQRPAVAGAPAGHVHVHMLATARFWRAGGRIGSRHWQWLARQRRKTVTRASPPSTACSLQLRTKARPTEVKRKDSAWLT